MSLKARIFALMSLPYLFLFMFSPIANSHSLGKTEHIPKSI